MCRGWSCNLDKVALFTLRESVEIKLIPILCTVIADIANIDADGDIDSGKYCTVTGSSVLPGCTSTLS